MKQLLMTAVLAVMTVVAQAQDKERKTPEERAKMRTAHMTEELDLSADQAARVEAINLKYAGQGEVLRKQREVERAEARKNGKALRDAHDAEMKVVLSPEQYANWQAKKESMKARRMEKRKAVRDRPSNDQGTR